MSNLAKKRRRTIVDQLREEGRKAAEQGKSRHSCPHSRYSMDRYQWLRGFDEAKQDSEPPSFRELVENRIEELKQKEREQRRRDGPEYTRSELLRGRTQGEIGALEWVLERVE